MSETQSGDLERDIYRDSLNWLTAVAAAAVAGLQFYEALGPAWASETPAAPSMFLGAILVFGIVIFLTSLWRPPLYLLGAVVGLYVLVVWALGGMAVEPTSLGTAVSAAALAVLSLVNFYREQVAYLSDEPQRATRR